MKELKLHYTTEKQSDELLSFGVPSESADMSFTVQEETHSIIPIPVCIPYVNFADKDSVKPCWSLGRLIEILNICYSPSLKLSYAYYIKQKDCNVGYVIQMIKLCSVGNVMDYSKLED